MPDPDNTMNGKPPHGRQYNHRLMFTSEARVGTSYEVLSRTTRPLDSQPNGAFDHFHHSYPRTYVQGFSDVHVKFISDVWMAGLLLPTPCRPRESGFGIGLGSDWSGPTYKVEIDHTTSFRADLHVGGAAIHLSLKFYGGVVAR